MSSQSQGGILPPADARHGTQVLYRWANWLQQHGFPRATCVAIFRKEGVRLVVHAYPQACVVLKIVGSKPKIREFREWRQSFAEVAAKLISRGWMTSQSLGHVKQPGVSTEWNQVAAATPFGSTWSQGEPKNEVSHAH